MKLTDQFGGAGSFFGACQAQGQFIQKLLFGAIGKSNGLCHAKNEPTGRVVHFFLKALYPNCLLLSHFESTLRIEENPTRLLRLHTVKSLPRPGILIGHGHGCTGTAQQAQRRPIG